MTIVRAALLLLLSTISVRAEPLVADLNDHLVAITTGFTGTNVLLFGAVDQPADIVAVIRGPDTAVKVRHKEKLAGIWVIRDSVDFPHIPAYYDIATTKPLDELLTPEMQRQYRLGLDALDIESSDKSDPEFRQALLRLKERQGLFRDRQSRIIFVGENLFRITMTLPAIVPTGAYTAEIYSVRDGQIVAVQTTPLIVSRVGFSADLYQIAHRHEVLYGFFAIGAAFLLGWVAHLLFRRR